MSLVAVLVIGNACHGKDQADRDALLRRSDAERLVGGWNVTLVLDHPLNQLYDPGATAHPIMGTIAFTENRTSDEEFADFGSVTHKGVYDLDLAVFGLPAANEAGSQSAVARTAPVRATQRITESPLGADSVIIALVPADTRLWMRLTGLLVGDSITGSWTAEFSRTAAAGRFVMTRQRRAP